VTQRVTPDLLPITYRALVYFPCDGQREDIGGLPINTRRRHTHYMRLAEARRRTGYSARGFAKATGSSTRTIWELEKGHRLPHMRTVRRFGEVLGVAVEEVAEFREAIWKEASRGAPLEVLAQARQMEEVYKVNLVHSSFMRVAAQRSLREVLEYLIRTGHKNDVERIYSEVCEKAAEQKED
jgi:transcriptional regulator with XRE-family HTH domain